MDYHINKQSVSFTNSDRKPEKRKYLWSIILFLIYIHYGAILGFYYLLTVAKWKSWIWLIMLSQMSIIGLAAGGHRLWAHRSYKAKLPLQIILAICQTLTFQKTIHSWARDHRQHHNFSETDSDPFDATKGFFYSHMGWMVLKKSQKVFSKSKTVDVSDLLNSPVVIFQKKYYWFLGPFVAFVIPAYVPWYFWDEIPWVSWYICSVFRFALTFHGTCCINSFAHWRGNRPYDKNVFSRDIPFLVEGYHNYHHAFPWDYKAAEFGHYFGNSATAFIDLMAKFGWAYDLKSVSPQLIEQKAEKSGDGSRKKNKTQNIALG